MAKSSPRHPGAHPDFLPGNDHARKMSEEENVELFKEMYEYSLRDDDSKNTALSIQDVFVKFKIPKSSFYYKCDKQEKCNEYKDMMLDVLIARVNRGALKGDLISTPAIFRMKNLGETDESTINQQHSGSMITEHKVTFQDYTGKE